jgi:hypothetical protein
VHRAPSAQHSVWQQSTNKVYTVFTMILLH